VSRRSSPVKSCGCGLHDRRDDESVGLLELPYSGTDLSMIILMPEIVYALPGGENPGLPDLEQKLNADNLRIWLAKLDKASPHETWVGLPPIHHHTKF
jgi:serine protease inhibitor